MGSAAPRPKIENPAAAQDNRVGPCRAAQRRYRVVCDRELTKREIVHYADDNRTITSYHNRVFVKTGGRQQTITLPESVWRSGLGFARLARRALRLDKCNVVPAGRARENLVIIRQGCVYHYDARTRNLQKVLQLRNCRNVLHQSIAVIGDAEIVFGEYGSNPDGLRPVPIYKSWDGGKSWRVLFEFPPNAVRHVHGCYWDPYEEKVWVLTGDYGAQVSVLVADRDFSRVERVGGGTQQWRAVNAFFEPDHVYWIMDSECETSRLIRLDRASRTLKPLAAFPGPAWYIKRTTDDYYFAATTFEQGPSNADSFAHLFVSRNLTDWHEAARFAWDGLPVRYFKSGVLGFADGRQSSRGFYLFGEALKGMDGKAWRCRLVEK